MNAIAVAPKLGKIVLVDDDTVVRLTVSQALKKAGYEVFAADDISKALGTVRRERPDLILLDLTFPLDVGNVGGPIQDGFFVIEWLRRTPEAEKIPIIIISATEPAKYKNQITAPGIVGCFRKPLKHDELLAAIHSALGSQPVAAASQP